ncbi:MAG: hypothetical protein ACRD0J_08800 [Acidimicrobiales bacterium]
MDLEAFYQADERRRASAEIELGRDWHDARGVRYELSWVADTGEVYTMREPDAGGTWSTPFGDWVDASLPEDALTVRVLGHLGSSEELESALAGWQEAMDGDDSIRWVLEALHGAGARPEGAPPPAPPSEAG